MLLVFVQVVETLLFLRLLALDLVHRRRLSYLILQVALAARLVRVGIIFEGLRSFPVGFRRTLLWIQTT